MDNPTITLAIHEAWNVSKDTDGTTEEKLVAAMQAMRNFWLSSDEDLQFRGAVGGVMLDIGQDHPDFGALQTEVIDLKKYGAFISALSAGVEARIPEVGRPRFNLLKLWHGTK